ncbi:DegT/DnrJ/EryC1/StrS family aminotransferase [Stieleria varia]|uniref:L-glutamine:2-deoxy-scyllo-inosose aminotransferase n=1 Tax=Stieleria varia TaxID=2528005 RepID=A0A5C5ZL60_9BACT|nr:aminotransferase class I/II-fold pyridoxal phosphate-dependent enzyme [Stieleria varia]TWT87928.1 L-glutamine:2-deoxy-scyllo-inosose aminotransferase [Stieleria varia]
MTFSCPIWPPQWPEIGSKLQESILSGDWGRYKSAAHEELRGQIASLSQCSHVRLMGSGSAAIEMALRTVGIGAGDEVILSAFDFPGNIRAIEATGATPVLVDVRPESLQLDLEMVQDAKSDRIKAVIASHLYGTFAPVGPLREICDHYGWQLVEDACQCPGSVAHGRPAGSWGNLAALSFGGSKPLCAGNGGALLSNDRRMEAKWNATLDRPSDTQPLSGLQATVLLPQLSRLREMNRQRWQTAIELQTLSSELGDVRWLSELPGAAEGPQDAKGQSDPSDVCEIQCSITHYKVAWLAKDSFIRDRVVRRAGEMGIPVGPAFRSMDRCSPKRCRKPFALPESRKLSECGFVLDHSALLAEGENRRLLVEAIASLLN